MRVEFERNLGNPGELFNVQKFSRFIKSHQKPIDGAELLVEVSKWTAEDVPNKILKFRFFLMWLLTKKASFVTFFGQIKGGALWMSTWYSSPPKCCLAEVFRVYKMVFFLYIRH